MNTLPPGLAGWVAADQMNRQKQAYKLQELQGILGLQQADRQMAMQEQMQPLQLRMLQAQVGNAENPAPIKIDAGGSFELRHPRTFQLLGSIPKTATPDAQLREQGSMTRHQTPSGSALLGEQGSMARHQTPSGSAILGERGAMARHASPSGSAVLSAETTRRGQDLDINPAIQAGIAAARAGGKERGESQAQAELALPGAISKAEEASRLINQMIGSQGRTLAAGDRVVAPHPGFETAVGATATPGLRFIEGTDTAGFMRMLDQLKGGAFLQAFETLKGGGQITQIEGEKATDAITRMSKSQSEREFVQAAREFESIIAKGVERAKVKAGFNRRSTDPKAEDPLGIR
jgi:ribosomal protein L34